MRLPDPETSHPLRILIAGAPKSGTTGLFFKIRHSMPGGAVSEMFEPAVYNPQSGDKSSGVLAKTLIGGPYEVNFRSFDCFEKRIGLVRDPRDWVISSLLYGIFDADFCGDDAVTSPILAMLRRKEEDPSSVSVLDLLRLIRSLWSPEDESSGPPATSPYHNLPLIRGIEDHYRWRMGVLTDFFHQNPGYFLLKYEDFVSERLEKLEQYLGFPLERKTKVDPQYHRVARTKRAGDWSNWFLAEDVEFFRPIFQGFMEEFGYEDDWSLNPERAISAEHASGYVRNLIAERRALKLMRDPAKAKELLERAREALKKVQSRYFSDTAATGEELEAEVVNLQVAVNFLAHQLAETERLNRELETAQGKAESVKARLEERKIKMQHLRLECQSMQKSFSWRVTRPLRSLARRFVHVPQQAPDLATGGE